MLWQTTLIWRRLRTNGLDMHHSIKSMVVIDQCVQVRQVPGSMVPPLTRKKKQKKTKLSSDCYRPSKTLSESHKQNQHWIMVGYVLIADFHPPVFLKATGSECWDGSPLPLPHNTTIQPQLLLPREFRNIYPVIVSKQFQAWTLHICEDKGMIAQYMVSASISYSCCEVRNNGENFHIANKFLIYFKGCFTIRVHLQKLHSSPVLTVEAYFDFKVLLPKHWSGLGYLQQ